jgi:hypothetical protein
MMTNSKKGMMVLGIFILIVAVILFIMYGVGKSGATDVNNTNIRPELEVSGEKIVTPTTVSGYMIKTEYLGTYLGDNITFRITVNTKGGFEELKVDTLKLYRYRDDGTLLTSEPRVINQVKNYTTYTIDFSGKTLIADAIPDLNGGENTFEIKAFKGEVPYTLEGTSVLATSEVRIEKSDINYTLESTTITPFPWSVKGSTVLDIKKSDIYRTAYTIWPFAGEPVYIIPHNTRTNVYSFQFGGTGTFFTVEGNTEFQVEKVDPFRYRFFVGDKMVTKLPNNSLVLKAPNLMTREEAVAAVVSIRGQIISCEGLDQSTCENETSGNCYFKDNTCLPVTVESIAAADAAYSEQVAYESSLAFLCQTNRDRDSCNDTSGCSWRGNTCELE